MSNYLFKTTRLFTFLSLISLITVTSSLFFPFITGKAILFHITVEIALTAFIVFLFLNPSYLSQIKNRLFHPVTLAVLAFAAIFLITSLIGVNPQNSFWSNFERAEGAVQILHYTAFFILLATIFTSQKDWCQLLWFFVGISAIIILYAIGQTIGLDAKFNYIIGNNASGTFGNTSYLGSFMSIAFFLTYWLFRNEKKPLLKVLLAIIAIGMLWGLYTSFATAALGAFGIGIALFAGLTSYRHHYKINRKKFLIGVLIALIVLAGATYLVFQSKSGDLYRSIAPRLWTWGSAFAGILEKPIFGWGAENFPVVFDKYYNARHYGIESWFDRAHNIFLDYLVSGGLLLLIAYLAIYYFYYKKLFRLVKNQWFPFFAVLPVIYLIQGLTIFEVLPMYIVLFIFLALFINYSLDFPSPNYQLSIVSRRLNPSRQAVIGLILAIALISLYKSAYIPLQKNLLIVKAGDVSGKSTDQALADYEEALSFPSPVGQLELEGNLYLTSFNLIEFLRVNKSPLLKNEEFLGKIIGFNEKWFDSENQIGTKNLYIFTAMMFKAYNATNNPQYLERTKELVALGAKLAPSRLEFLEFEAQIAASEKDQETIKSLREKLKKLRPDLNIFTSTVPAA